MTQAIKAPNGPVARPNVAGREKIPAPTTIAVSVSGENLCSPETAASTDATMKDSSAVDDTRITSCRPIFSTIQTSQYGPYITSLAGISVGRLGYVTYKRLHIAFLLRAQARLTTGRRLDSS